MSISENLKITFCTWFFIVLFSYGSSFLLFHVTKGCHFGHFRMVFHISLSFFLGNDEVGTPKQYCDCSWHVAIELLNF